MNLGSLFDGSGGFPLAGAMNGITPLWASEVEPYPIAVTRSRFPHMKHYGNVCKINGAEVEPVDIVSFGSPCQDLSVAGKRAGIQDGERSNLFFEAVRIIKEMREATNGEYPKYAVWENVPGAFSSNKGHDFHAVIESLCSVCDDTVSIPEPYDPKRPDKLLWSGAGQIMGNGYSLAWRTFDAQYWGVPQRRKRIYLICDFTGQRAGEILFERNGLRGNLQTSNEARQGATVDAVGGVDGSVGVNDNNCLTPYDVQSRRCFSADGAWPALYGGEGGGHGYVISLQANGIDRADTAVACFQNTGRGWWNESEVAATVRTACGGDSVKANLAVRETLCFDETQITSPANGNNPQWNEPSHPLASTARPPTVICKQPPRRYIIRRLTPTECARLQGFPDWWSALAPYDPADADFWEDVRKTHAEINGKVYKPVKNLKAWYEKLHNDGAEYKMWGNGIALPCAEYVMRGIKKKEENHAFN